MTDKKLIAMLRNALLAVYQDIELANVKGGSDELQVLVSEALLQSETQS